MSVSPKMMSDVKPVRCALHVYFVTVVLLHFTDHPQILLLHIFTVGAILLNARAPAALKRCALCFWSASCVSFTYHDRKRVCLVQTMLALCWHGSSFFSLPFIARVRGSIYRRASFVILIREVSDMQHSKQPRPDLRDRLVYVHVSILCQLSVFHTAACTCELR